MTTPYSTHEKTIYGHKYLIKPFPSRYGLNIMARLTKYASNVFSVILPVVAGSTSAKAILNIKLTGDLIDQLLTSIQASLTDPALIDLIVEMVKYVSRDGESLENEDYFNLVFAENYEELFVLLKEVIVINFLSQSFIKKMFTNMIEQKAKAPTQAQAKNG
jgi:hypothetical protein